MMHVSGGRIRCMTRIYKKLKRKKLKFDHVCEVGVYFPEYSNVIDFIKEGVKATLVEADPVSIEKIKAYFKKDDVTIFAVAIWDHNGKITLSKAKASTFVTELGSSPAILNDRHKISEAGMFEAECKKFSEIDDGTIDLLSADIEGSEWYVIKNLVSRPKIISVETHGKYYTNPFIREIISWMKEQKYVIWYKDKSDTVFVRSDIFLPGLGDKMETRLTEWLIKWKKFKRIFKIRK
jgi:FkbM family methyltransferase